MIRRRATGAPDPADRRDLPLLELGMPQQHCRRRRDVDPIQRGGNRGDVGEVANDRAVSGAPVAAGDWASTGVASARHASTAGEVASPIYTVSGRGSSKRIGGRGGGGAIRDTSDSLTDRRVRHHIGATKRASGDSPRADIGCTTKSLRGEACGGLGREALPQRGTDETAQHISAPAGRQTGISGRHGEGVRGRSGATTVEGTPLSRMSRTRFLGSGACRRPRIETREPWRVQETASETRPGVASRPSGRAAD